MPSSSIFARLARRTCAGAAIATLLGLSTAAHATADWLTVAPTCVPDSAQSLDFGLTSQAGGFVRSSGRNPPVAYFCPVWNPDDLVATPSWKFLKLQYLDPNASGGGVTATLYQKNRSNGTVALAASVTSTPTTIVKVVTVPLPAPLNFKRYAYYVTLNLEGPDLPVEAHMVMLTTN